MKLKEYMKKIYAISIITAALVLPLLAGAQAPPPNSAGIVPVKLNEQPVPDLIDKVLNFVFGLFLAISVLFIIYAAYLYLMSGGDEEKTKEAKKWIWATVVALIIAFLSKTIIGVVRSVLSIN